MLSFSFLHASDLHLEQPILGVSEAPDWLRDRLLDAPIEAARRVFDAAVSRQVDFVLLSGDVLHPLAGGARPWAELLAALERMAAAGIAVYWAAGRSETAAEWPGDIALPPAVRRFPRPEVEPVLAQRGQTPLAQILGRGFDGSRLVRPGAFQPSAAPGFAIALAYGSLPAGAELPQSISYWALGGDHARRSPSVAGGSVHYPGSPQGRRPRETGPHGCTLVEVDSAGGVSLRPLSTDALRWHAEAIELDRAASRPELERLLLDRAARLPALQPDLPLLVEWTVRGDAQTLGCLRRGNLAGELLARLRAEFGKREPGLWSVSLSAESRELPASCYDDPSLLGEFLRTVQQFAENPDLPLDVEPLLSDRHQADELGAALRISDPADRARTLHDVALLGVDLLAPEDSQA